MALVMAPITGSSAPAAGAVGSYYASAAAWAGNAVWLWSADKLAWGVPIALVSGVITALIVRWFKGNWIVSLIAGMGGTVGGAWVVLLGLFVINFVRYPIIHEAQLQSRPHTFGSAATFRIFDALRAANLQVPGGWNIIFTYPPEEAAQVLSNLTTILQKALAGCGKSRLRGEA
jgi:hypothetical protein